MSFLSTSSKKISEKRPHIELPNVYHGENVQGQSVVSRIYYLGHCLLMHLGKTNIAVD